MKNKILSSTRFDRARDAQGRQRKHPAKLDEEGIDHLLQASYKSISVDRFVIVNKGRPLMIVF